MARCFYSIGTLDVLMIRLSVYPMLAAIQFLLTLSSYLLKSKVILVVLLTTSIVEICLFARMKSLYNKKVICFSSLYKILAFLVIYMLLSVKINLQKRSEEVSFTSGSGMVKAVEMENQQDFIVYTYKKGCLALNEKILGMPQNLTYKAYTERVPEILGSKQLLVLDNWLVTKQGNNSKSLQKAYTDLGFNFLGSVLKLSTFGEGGMDYYLGKSSSGDKSVLKLQKGNPTRLPFEEYSFTSKGYKSNNWLREEDIFIGEVHPEEDFTVSIQSNHSWHSKNWPPVFPLEYNWLNHTNELFLPPSFFGMRSVSSIQLTKTGPLFTQTSTTFFEKVGRTSFPLVSGSISWIIIFVNFLPLCYSIMVKRERRLQLIIETLPLFSLEQGLALIETEYKLVILWGLGWFACHFCSVYSYSDRIFSSWLRFNKVGALAEMDESCFRRAVIRYMSESSPGFKLDFRNQHISKGNLKLNRLFFIYYLCNLGSFQMTFLKLLSYSNLNLDYSSSINPENYLSSMVCLLKDGITYRLFSKQGYIKNYSDFETAIICYDTKKGRFLDNLRRYSLLGKYNYDTLSKAVAYVMHNLRRPLPNWLATKNVIQYNLEFDISASTTLSHSRIEVKVGEAPPESYSLTGPNCVLAMTAEASQRTVRTINTKESVVSCKTLTLNSSQLYFKSGRTKVKNGEEKGKPPKIRLLRSCCTKCLGSKGAQELIQMAMNLKSFELKGRRKVHGKDCAKILDNLRKQLSQVPTYSNRKLNDLILKKGTGVKTVDKTSVLDRLLLSSDVTKRFRKIVEKSLLPDDLKPRRGRKYTFQFKGGVKAGSRETKTEEISYRKSTTSHGELVPTISTPNDILSHIARMEDKFKTKINDSMVIICGRKEYRLLLQEGKFYMRTRKGGVVSISPKEWKTILPQREDD